MVTYAAGRPGKHSWLAKIASAGKSSLHERQLERLVNFTRCIGLEVERCMS